MPLKQISVKDREMQTIQTNTAAAITDLESATQINMTKGAESQSNISTPFTGGHLLTGVVLVPSQDNLVAHKLGKVPTVWVICGVDVATNIWSPKTDKLAKMSADAQYLNLQCTASTATISLWVA